MTVRRNFPEEVRLPEDAPIGATHAELETALASLRADDMAAVTIVADIRGQLTRLDAEAAQRASDAELRRSLLVQYRENQLATIVADVAEAAIEERMRGAVDPVAEQLVELWAQLWPGRPTLELNDGKLAGRIGETKLDFASLSGGERMVALICLKLVTLQALTTAPWFVIDEPLEHLDPPNRRLLALLLSSVASQGAVPRQLLVTTYEESVVRALDKPSQGSRVQYVRAV